MVYIEQALLLVLAAAYWFWPVVICLQKGKPVMAFLGVVAPGYAWIGAMLLARPDSSWARQYYDEAMMARSVERFGDSSARANGGPATLSEPAVDNQRSST